MKKKDLLSLDELSATDIQRVLARAVSLKKARKLGKNPQPLKGKSLGLVFEKPSTRTKVSFDVAMYELGGQAISLESTTSQLGRGETHLDTGRVLSRYLHGIVIRTFAQRNVEELAQGASVPVINGLSDLYHPCQILADLLTIQEVKKNVVKCNIAYVGDGNNMANTWVQAATILGFNLRIATPAGFELPAVILKHIDNAKGANIVVTLDPEEAVRGADVVNTDTWFSMGQELSSSTSSSERRAAGSGETETKRKVFAPYQVNRALMQHAKKEAIVLHCLPAHRGEEITDEVMDGPQSRVWDQAENRLHVQKAILEMLLK